MFKELTSVSDELLAAYLDGNTTLEENLAVLKLMQHSEQERESLEIACNSLDIPAFFAASSCQAPGNLCVIRSERYVLEKRGKEIAEEALMEIALQNRWYDPEKGTPLRYIGKLLEYFGLDVERRFGRKISDLVLELEAGHEVIACVDGGELTDDSEQEKYEDQWIGEIPDHVVIIRRVDYTDKEQPEIEVYDVATEGKYQHYPLERFIDSWRDSKYYMICVK